MWQHLEIWRLRNILVTVIELKCVDAGSKIATVVLTALPAIRQNGPGIE
jgi:hypothetical protein